MDEAKPEILFNVEVNYSKNSELIPIPNEKNQECCKIEAMSSITQRMYIVKGWEQGAMGKSLNDF